VNPVIPQLDPIPLPAPAWLLWGLLLLTFVLHLLPMNFVLGGSLIAIVTRRRARGRAGSHEARLADWFSHAMPVVIAATVTLGVAALLFVQVLYGRLFFASSIVMGWFWLAVVPLVIVAYYSAYAAAFRAEPRIGGRAPLMWVMWACFLAVGFIYTNNMTLMLRPAEIAARYQADARGLHLNLGDLTVVPRFLHMLVGAVAVSGLVVAFLGVARRRREPEFGAWAIRHGALWFLIATGVNVVVGLAWFVTLPRDTMLQLMGRDLFATAVFGSGIVMGLIAMGLVGMTALSTRPVGVAAAGAGATLLTIVLMILNRDQVRQAALDGAGFAPAQWIAPQWGPIAIFAVLLVAAIAVVIWMVAKLATAPRRTPQM
jgi:hypothetical protein